MSGVSAPARLREKLAQRIALNGPLSMAEFMAVSMGDPDCGYYANAAPFGAAGDFITAPEISQMFGELIGIWVALSWQALGRPGHFILCEGGPGRGTLADDMLRCLAQAAPACFAAAEPVLLETSPRLRQEQRRKLAHHGKAIRHIADFAELENSGNAPLAMAAPPAADAPLAVDAPLIFIANELFDVLPIHQYQKTAEGWREKLLTLADSAAAPEAQGDEPQFQFAYGAPQPLPAFIEDAEFAALCRRAPPGAIAETSPTRSALAAALGRAIARRRGAALLIDYGELAHGLGDTLQAVAQHKYAPLLTNIGGADLSSQVDFAALAAAARREGAKTSGLTQGEFLLGLGLAERAGRLGAGKSAAEQAQIRAAAERLAAPQQMGRLFKTLCIADSDTEMPPFAWQNHR